MSREKIPPSPQPKANIASQAIKAPGMTRRSCRRLFVGEKSLMLITTRFPFFALAVQFTGHALCQQPGIIFKGHRL
jgi:hypothetical protein